MSLNVEAGIPPILHCGSMPEIWELLTEEQKKSRRNEPGYENTTDGILYN